MVTCKERDERLLVGECNRKGVEDFESSWGDSEGDTVTSEEGQDRLELLRLFHVLVTFAINHADTLPLWLIISKLSLLTLYGACNLSLGPTSTSFLFGGCLDRAQQFNV